MAASSEESKCPHLAKVAQAATDAEGKGETSTSEPQEQKGGVQGQGVYYGDYLGLKQLLSAQNCLTNAHEELLFIITHQTYELWFKQILFELRSVCTIFEKNPIPSADMLIASRRLKRVCEIQRVCIQQFRVLESMAPMEFMEFRNALVPASGFQSHQFRELEITLGMLEENRTKLGGCVFLSALTQEHQDYLAGVSAKPNLFQLVEKWLERTPFVNMEGWNFWSEYKKAVRNMLNKERVNVENEWGGTSSEAKKLVLADLEQVESRFDALFSEESYEENRKAGKFRLSHRALQAAILIELYRNEPSFHVPFEFLTALINVDENMSLWRHSHAQMVHRMIGVRLGTGGSSGVFYLRSTTGTRYRIYNDLANIATFIIPEKDLPAIPPAVQKQMCFYYDVGNTT